MSMFKYILFAILLISPLFIFSQNPQEIDQIEETVMVRTVETYSQIGTDFPNVDSKIIVSYSDGSTRFYSLKPNGIRYLEDNTKMIHRVLSQFMTSEYELISEMSSGGDNVNSYVWIFKKK